MRLHLYAHHVLQHHFHHSASSMDQDQRIKLHGHRWVCVTNHSGQQLVISFRLQGWRNKVSNLHWMTIQNYSAPKDSTAHLENRDGLFFLQAEIATLPRGTKLQTHSAQQGHIGMIAPTTALTPQGPADTGYAGDYWQFNTQGELVRAHRQYRKTLFTPSRTQCPVPAEQLEDHRRIRPKDGATNALIEDKYQITDAPNKAQQQMWKGETAFRTKKGTALPETQQQQFRRLHHK